ncbi:MAG TPA: hypothetical protein VEG44_09055 [Candidatus Acidoferrales bacterium]|nr:hypothetical protein [Candidatus Acidoferrales bacterium]
MTQHNHNNSPSYTGDEEPDSEPLIRKARKLSPDAQNVLYALLRTEGEDDPAEREGVKIDEIQEACPVCNLRLEDLDEDDSEHNHSAVHNPSFEETVRDAVAELSDRVFIEMKGERMYLKTRVDHIRTFEKVLERGKYAISM